MGGAALDGARRGNQRLADHLSAEDALPADLRAASAEEVVFERLEVEHGKQRLDRVCHVRPSRLRQWI